jgi:hypothetical protein
MTAWAPTTLLANGSYCWRVKALDASNNVISTSNSVLFNVGTAPPPPPDPTTYVPVTPVRLLDSRNAIGLSGAFTSNTARSVDIAGRLGIPGDAVAITANLTVTGQEQGGYLAVTPDPNNDPSTSTLNFPVKDTRANNITTPLADDGQLSIVYRSTAGKKANVLLDVTGYFLENNTGATYTALAPVRLLDTREANGLTGPFVSHTVRTFNVRNRGGVPADATAVTGNVTIVSQQAAGYVTLAPALADNPETSSLNFPLGDTRANGITVRLANDGSLSAIYIAAAGKTAHVLFDVTGYYVEDESGAKFYPLDPGRVLDSRSGVGLSSTFKTGIGRTLTVRGSVGVPTAAIAVTGNLTVTQQTAGGFLAMTQATTNDPSTSTLSFPIADTRANGVTGPLSGSGTVGLTYRTSQASKTTHVLLDINGYFAP